jgi:uncharacterized protein (DUF2147 family)
MILRFLIGRLLTAGLFLMLAATGALADSPAVTSAASLAVTGVWWTPRHNGKIVISIDDKATANGRLIAIEPKHADELDAQNPDASLRARPVLGLVVFQGFKQNAEGLWDNGTLYDPQSGSTYAGSMRLDADGNLLLRGTVLFGLFGKTRTLNPVAGDTPMQAQPGEPQLVYVKP